MELNNQLVGIEESEISLDWMTNEPLVSVICIAYNQKNYIEEALKGFLMQKTSFAFEVLVHDDASTDLTPKIIEGYAKRYPHIIKPIYQSINQFSQGKRILALVIPEVKGKYIAVCDGDDQWTDPNKLQIQVDFLQNNPDFSICFHNVNILNQINKEIVLYDHKPGFNKSVFVIEDFYLKNLIVNCSVMYRWEYFNGFPDWFHKMKVGDWSIHLMHLQYGKAKYLDNIMACYRMHSEGYWSGSSNNNPNFKVNIHKNLYQNLPNNLPGFDSIILTRTAVLKFSSEVFEFYLNHQMYKQITLYFYENIRYLGLRDMIILGYKFISRLLFFISPSAYVLFRKIVSRIKSVVSKFNKLYVFG